MTPAVESSEVTFATIEPAHALIECIAGLAWLTVESRSESAMGITRRIRHG